jgi:hypothetical protein
MKRYIVHDLQGAGFMDYSWQEPLTAQQIRAIRWADYLNFKDEVEGNLKWSDFTLAFIADFWELRFELAA